MKLTPNPRYNALVDILHRHRKHLRPWQGDGFRSATLQYARSEKLIDGKGAYRHGSRWSAPRAFRCVNLSTMVNTAWQESHWWMAQHLSLRQFDAQSRRGFVQQDM